MFVYTLWDLSIPVLFFLCNCCSPNQPLFLSLRIQQVNVYSLLLSWFMACYCCSSLILLNTADWLPFQTPCHSILCTVTAGPPWGPYTHSNWFGKDLAAFELKRHREDGSDLEGEMEREKKEKRARNKGRGGDSLCGWLCNSKAILFFLFYSWAKKRRKHRAITLTY